MGKSLRDKIEQPSFGYSILRITANITFRLFYKKIYVYGKKNIPSGHPVIFAPNHQNAVMDPLAILFTQKNYIVFLARSDVFNGKFLIRLLTFLKILPIYRQRDGIENLAKNEEIFDITVRILKKKKKICLMPEGNHGNQNKLRPLVKGMFRIAFTAQDNLIDQSKPVQIVPTGLYYENYVKFDKVLCVNYGKPLDLANYHKLYKEKPALAINRLKKDLSDALSECMINIKSQKYYESINFVTNTFSKYYSKTIKQSYFEVLKDFTEKFNIFEEKKAIFLPQFHEFVTSYTRLLDKYNLRDWVIKRQPFSLIKITWVIGLLILSFPLFIPGFVLNYLPFTVPVKPTKKIKDLQFHSSVRYVILVLFMIFYYPIISVAVGFIFKSYLWGIITFFGSFFLGIISLKISYLYKKIMAMLRFNKLKKNNIGEAHLLISLREKIQIFTDFVFKS